VDIWGKRKFAYEIDKKTEGLYIVLTFTAKSETAKELDRQLGLNESVLRTKLMRLDAK
jgi:small subunit ribosomal protein S6